MNKKMTPAARRQQMAQAQALHAIYGNYNQQASDCDTLMANNKHPCGALYRTTRAFFDSLRFACNAGARLVALKTTTAGETAFSIEFWAMRLSLPWNCYREVDGEYFGHIYPAHDRWDRYVQAHINTRFSLVNKDNEPLMTGGSFHINFKEDAALPDVLLDAVKDYIAAHPALNISDCDYGIHVTFEQHLTASAFNGFVRLLRRYCRGGVWLPKRQPENDTADQAPLPIAQRTVMHGNVKAVTDNGRIILVPLVPMGPEGRQIAVDLCNDLLKKVDEGLPWSTVRCHVKNWLQPAVMTKLERQYGQKA